jgi:hypothetical protein
MSGGRDCGQLCQRRIYSFFRIWSILKLAGEITLVGIHVEMPVPTQGEEYSFSLAGLLTLQSLVDYRADGMVALRRWNDPFGCANCRPASNVANCGTATASISPSW